MGIGSKIHQNDSLEVRATKNVIKRINGRVDIFFRKLRKKIKLKSRDPKKHNFLMFLE